MTDYNSSVPDSQSFPSGSNNSYIPTQSTRSTQPPQPAQPAQPAQPVPPSQPAQPVQPSQPAQPVQPVPQQTVPQQTVPQQTVQSSQPAPQQTVQPSQPTPQPVQPTQPAPQPVQSTQPMGSHGSVPPSAAVPPASNNNGGFVLSLLGLIFGVLGISIPGLVLSIIGFGKARKAKGAGHVTGKPRSSWIMGLIGIILSGVGLASQIILTTIILTAGIGSIPLLNEGFYDISPSTSISGGAKSASVGTFEGESAKPVANDLKKALINDLKASNNNSDQLDVKGLKTSLINRYVDEDGYNCKTVKGNALIDYKGKSKKTDFTLDYIQFDDGWYLYNYTLDNYDLFPQTFAPRRSIAQGNYVVSTWDSQQSTTTPQPQEPSYPTVSDMVGSYTASVWDIPATAPYSGIAVYYDEPVYLEIDVYGNTADVYYELSGYDPDGYVSVSLPVYLEDAFVFDNGDSTFSLSGVSECQGVYVNNVGGGAQVTGNVRVEVNATIYPDGTIEGYMTQSLIGFQGPEMYNPGSVFDNTFSFSASM